jgi:biotin carboxyl carrier protein
VKFRARAASGASPETPLAVERPAPAFSVIVNGNPVAGHAASVRPGVWSFVLEDGRQVEVSLEPHPDGMLRAWFGGAVMAFELVDELAALAQAGGAQSRSRKGNVVPAAMPGRVLRVAVAAGEAVKAGQPLLVLEAMKMENEVKSPRDGVIDAVVVVAGQAVSAGDVLVKLRPEG